MRTSSNWKPTPTGPDMYVDLAKSSFGEPSIQSGSEWMMHCTKHEDHGASLQFNVDKGLFVCFSCGWSGNARTIERDLGIKYREPETAVADILARLDALNAQTHGPEAPQTLPESLLKRYRFPTDYWGGRGFTDATVAAFDLGFDPMENTAVIPVRSVNGELNGFIRRYLDPDWDGPKYKMPKGYPRRTNMFGSWLVQQDPRDEVVICEGPVDAMMVWQAGFPAVAQYGSSIAKEQVRLLRRLGFNKAVLFYDNDRAGIRAAEGYMGTDGRPRPGAINMLRGFDVRRVEYQDAWVDSSGRRIKDPGGLSMKTIRKAVNTAIRV